MWLNSAAARIWILPTAIWTWKKTSSLRWDLNPSRNFNCSLVRPWTENSVESCLDLWLTETVTQSIACFKPPCLPSLLHCKYLIYFLLPGTALETKCRYKCYSKSADYFSICLFVCFLTKLFVGFSFLWIPGIVLEGYLYISGLSGRVLCSNSSLCNHKLLYYFCFLGTSRFIKFTEF